MSEHDGYMTGYSSTNYDPDSDGSATRSLKLNFNELKRLASVALSRQCTKVKLMSMGGRHKIFALFFEPQTPGEPKWSCIARTPRRINSGTIMKTSSELETMRYVREKTTIPVPEVYFYNLDPKNTFGAPFVLMERMAGRDLYHLLDNCNLSTEHKMTILMQLTDVIAQLATLEFEKVGSLQKDGLGPILDGISGSRGPFESTLEYLLSSLKDMQPVSVETSAMFEEMKLQLQIYLETHQDDICLQTPYRLIHDDFNGQNMMFTIDAEGFPQLSGIIDWEYSYTGPLHHLYRYPYFIIDSYYNQSAYTENKLLRQQFTRSLRQKFPRGSAEALIARVCLCSDSKSHISSKFRGILDVMKPGELKETLTAYLEKLYLEDSKNGAKAPSL